MVLIENTKSLQSKHKKLFATLKNEEAIITMLSYLSEPRMTNKQHTWKKGTTLIMGDSILSGLREFNFCIELNLRKKEWLIFCCYKSSQASFEASFISN